jgi:hypothetical protein
MPRKSPAALKKKRAQRKSPTAVALRAASRSSPAAKELCQDYDHRIRDRKKQKLNDDGSELDEDDDMFVYADEEPATSSSSSSPSSSSASSSNAVNDGQRSNAADNDDDEGDIHINAILQAAALHFGQAFSEPSIHGHPQRQATPSQLLSLTSRRIDGSHKDSA